MPFLPFFVDSRACEARYQKLSSSIEEAVMREEAADFGRGSPGSSSRGCRLLLLYQGNFFEKQAR